MQRDLWSTSRELVKRRLGDNLSFKWMNSHRSCSDARARGDTAIINWFGNHRADSIAKHVFGMFGDSPRAAIDASARRAAKTQLVRLALAAEVGLNRFDPPPRKRFGVPPPRALAAIVP